jgi:hypothetical protein
MQRKWVLGMCLKKWKLKYQVEAEIYCEQLKYVSEDVDKPTELISTRCGLNNTIDEIRAQLLA